MGRKPDHRQMLVELIEHSNAINKELRHEKKLHELRKIEIRMMKAGVQHQVKKMRAASPMKMNEAFKSSIVRGLLTAIGDTNHLKVVKK